MSGADIIHTDIQGSCRKIATSLRAALQAGALPLTIGEEHSVNIPFIDSMSHKRGIQMP
ncbi:arginase family protein [Tateyamaria pelophila]|uniref:arginase family protein n=1 Tax=Tateyamaria pelophila TaxID=328415 RepID=UPI0037D9E60A